MKLNPQSIAKSYRLLTLLLLSFGLSGELAIFAQGQTPATPFPLGAYLTNPDNYTAANEAVFEANYASFSKLMGTGPQFLVRYLDQDHDISQWAGDASWSASSQRQSPAADAIPVIGFPSASKASDAPPADQQFRAFAAGQYDSLIQNVVQIWQQNGYTTQYWRIGWEMNLNSAGSTAYAGTDPGTQADWVAAFTHIAAVLRQAGTAANVTVKIIWNPSVTNYEQTGTLANLYPGNGSVDIIAADIYADMYPYGIPGNSSLSYDRDKNNGTDDTLAQFIADPVDRAHYWTYPAATQYSLDGSQGHALSLQNLLDFAKKQGKPFAVAETGAGNSSGGHDAADDDTFPTWLARTLQSSGSTIAFVDLWDANADGNYLFSGAGAGKPNEAAAWAQGFGALTTTAWYTIANLNSSACVDLDAGNGTNGTRVQQWRCGVEQTNQEWQLRPASGGFYTIASRNAPGSVLDVVNGGTGNGTPVQLWQSYGNTHQQWMPVSLGNGCFQFVGLGSKRCLCVPGAATGDGVQLSIYNCNGTSAEAWKLSTQP